MSTNVRSLLQFLLIPILIGLVFFWSIKGNPASFMWTMRIGLPGLAILIIWLLVRHGRRTETLHDHLQTITPRYFECNGLCFAFAIRVNEGICWLHIFYQNRYANPCGVRVALKPVKFVGRHAVKPIDVLIGCDGGAFGFMRIPWAIPQKYQGRKVTCDVGAVANYPSGRGKMLRFREGVRVGGISTAATQAGSAALSILLGTIGVIRISRSASTQVRLPTSVAKQVPDSLATCQETVWRPDLPTGGFPVIMPDESLPSVTTGDPSDIPSRQSGGIEN